MSEFSAASRTLIEERIRWLDAEMEAALSTASPDLDLYRWARYHLGWLDEDLQPLDEAGRRRYGGKRLRGVLTILAAEAVGGDGPSAATGGAAVEFIHNFSLVHDDIEDGDEERRHRPTVWRRWSVPHAINVGSNMQAMVDLSLLRLRGRVPSAVVVEAFDVITRAVVLMTEGQFLDMAAQDAREMSLDEYFRMTGGKTAALIEAALRLGGLLGSPDPEVTRCLASFGRSFGLAFQCRDDYLGIWGEPALTGKPVGSDLLRGKRSLPVVHALQAAAAGSASGDRLRHALTERDVPAALALFEELHTAAFVTGCVREHTDRALAALDSAFRLRPAVEPFGTAIREITAYALGRES